MRWWLGDGLFRRVFSGKAQSACRVFQPVSQHSDRPVGECRRARENRVFLRRSGGSGLAEHRRLPGRTEPLTQELQGTPRFQLQETLPCGCRLCGRRRCLGCWILLQQGGRGSPRGFSHNFRKGRTSGPRRNFAQERRSEAFRRSQADRPTRSLAL